MNGLMSWKGPEKLIRKRRCNFTRKIDQLDGLTWTSQIFGRPDPSVNHSESLSPLDFIQK